MLDQIIAQVIATSPMAGVLLIIFLLQRKDYREDQARHAAEMKSERDARAAENKADKDRTNGWLDKFLGAMKGD